MKALLKFELPEEISAYDKACKAEEYHQTLHEISEYLNNNLKIQGKLSKEVLHIIREIRDIIPRNLQ